MRSQFERACSTNFLGKRDVVSSCALICSLASWACFISIYISIIVSLPYISQFLIIQVYSYSSPLTIDQKLHSWLWRMYSTWITYYVSYLCLSLLWHSYGDCVYRIGVDEWMRVPSLPDVFSIGDCCGYLQSTGKPTLPALAQASH